MGDRRHDVRIALLGPLVVEVGGEPVDVPAGHQRTLLAALALAAGRAVPTDRLIDLLWADDPPPTARNSLQSHLARLRRHLGRPDAIVREEFGYRLDVGDGAIDVGRFDALVDEATRTADPGGRRRLLDRAIDLWRADEPSAVTGLPDDARRLLSQRSAALLARASTALVSGETAISERDALAVLRTDPHHEPAVVLLVRALAAAGRTAEADAAVRDFRDRLADELGLDPSSALEEVHTALLRGRLAPSTRIAPPPDEPGADRTGTVRAGNAAVGTSASTPDVHGRSTRPALPRSSFRGREVELEALIAGAASHRCVTVVGPGGVGKTRLALERAHRERRAVVWADLVEARTDRDVLGRLAMAAGSGTPADTTTLSPLAEALTGHEALVVLDNCEQAVAEVADVVDALLRTTDVTVLATSRTPLSVDGELVFDLAPLPTTSPDGRQPPALTLFADRVGRALDLTTAEDRSAAADVVDALDGLPLALELAARHVRNLGIESVRDRLDHRLELLRKPRDADHPAHADLRSLVRWSTELLDASDRRAFRWLSVFAGTFTLSQAEALLGYDGANVPMPAASVARLVEQSLVERRPPNRFLLLDTLRVCGAEELVDAGEVTAARARHTEIIMDAAETHAETIGTSREPEGLAAMDAMIADLQIASERLVDDGDLGGLCRLACALRDYAYETQRPELLRVAGVAVGLFGDGDGGAVTPALRDGTMVAAAIEATARGDVALARRLVEPVTEAEPTSPAAAPAWNLLGDTRLWGVEADAEAAYREAVRLGEERGDAAMAATGLVGVVLARAYAGDVADARRLADELQRRAQRLGSPLISAWAAYARGEAEADHDPDAALASFELAIEWGHEVGGHLVVAVASSGAAAVRTRHGDPATVLHHVRDTLHDLRGSGNASVQQSVLRNIAVLLTRMGSDEAAAILLGATSSSHLYEAERRRIDVATRSLTERLGAETFSLAGAAGAQMAPGDVVGVALEAVDRLVDERLGR